jgi:hypothetical protein
MAYHCTYLVISATGVHHEDQNLIIHAAGETFNQLVLRNVVDCAQSSPRGQGFTIQLEGGVTQLEHFGSGSWSTVPEFLAITSSEIYHLKTLSLTDHIRSSFVGAADPLQSVALEPVQKWVPNFSTACISGSKSSWSHSFLLSTQQRLFTLNCEEGVRPHCASYAGNIFDGATSSPDSADVCIEATSHPQVCLLARGHDVFRKDLRESGHASLLFRSLDRRVSSLLSLPPSHAVSHCPAFLVGIEGGLMLMDARHVKKCVGQRTLPGDHCMVRGGLSTDDFFQPALHSDTAST